MTDEPTAVRGSFIQALRRSAWLIVLSVLVLAAAAYVYSVSQAKSYVATSSVVVQDPVLAITGSPSTAQLPAALAATEAARINRPSVSSAVAARVGAGLTESSASSAISTYVDPTSNAVDITATARTGLLAARIANAFAIKDAEQTDAAVERQYAAQAALTYRQYYALGQPSNTDGVRAALSTVLVHDQQLAKNAPAVQVNELAVATTNATSPKTWRNVGILAAVGLVLGVILADLRRARWSRRAGDDARPAR